MKTKRIALGILGVAVAAALAVLLFGVTSSADGEAASDPAPRAAAPVETTEVVPMGPPRVRPAVKQQIEAGEPAEAADQDPTRRILEDGTTEYMKEDGTLVRDHRTADPQPPRPRAIASSTTATLRTDLRDIVKDCARPIRQRDMTARFDLQVEATVSVKDRRLRIDGLDLKTDGFEDEEFTSCARTALEGLELDTPAGQPDVDAHTITLPFRLP